MCACLTPEQIERLGSQSFEASTAPGGMKQSGGILITPSTVAPPPGGDPVLEIPVGALGEDRKPAPPTVDSYVAPEHEAPAFQPSEAADEESGLSLVVIAFIGGTLLVIAATTTLVCALWSSYSDNKRRGRVKFVVAAPRFSPHVPVEKCPQPPVAFQPPAAPMKLAVSLQEPAIRVSWTSSNASSNSRMQVPRAAQQHLQLPDGDRALKGSPSLSKGSRGSQASTCSGGASGTSSMSSNSAWAVKREPQSERPKLGSKGGFGNLKPSRVYPGSEQVFA